jgi:hypothetical protein
MLTFRTPQKTAEMVKAVVYSYPTLLNYLSDGDQKEIHIRDLNEGQKGIHIRLPDLVSTQPTKLK